jgi:hypothetical protein
MSRRALRITWYAQGQRGALGAEDQAEDQAEDDAIATRDGAIPPHAVRWWCAALARRNRPEPNLRVATHGRARAAHQMGQGGDGVQRALSRRAFGVSRNGKSEGAHTMDMRVEALDLKLRTPFRISRGVQLVAENLLVTLAANGLTGIGEAVPDDDFGEQRALVLAARLGDDPLLLEDITAEFERVFPHGNAPAKAALDMALYDLVGKQLNLPIYRLLGLTPARTPVSSFTIAIDTPEVMAEKARASRTTPFSRSRSALHAMWRRCAPSATRRAPSCGWMPMARGPPRKRLR